MFDTILTEVLKAVLVILAGALAAAGIAWAKGKLNELRVSGSPWVGQLEEIAGLAVKAAEQNGLAKLIDDTGKAKKAYALKVAQTWLDSKGIKVDLTVIEAAIEAAVLEQFNPEAGQKQATTTIGFSTQAVVGDPDTIKTETLTAMRSMGRL